MICCDPMIISTADAPWVIGDVNGQPARLVLVNQRVWGLASGATEWVTGNAVDDTITAGHFSLIV